MAISFHCPECGRDYEVSDALAGKKGRCKGCKSVFEIPAFSIDADESPYQVAQEVARAPTKDTGVAWRLLLEAGDQMGSFDVKECSANRLELAVPVERNLQWPILGVVLLGFVACFFAMNRKDDPKINANKQRTFAGYAILYASVAAASPLFCQIARLGHRLTFDRASRSFSSRWTLGAEKTWEAGELGGIVYWVERVVIHTNTHQGGGFAVRTVQKAQTCKAYVVDRLDRGIALIAKADKVAKSGYLTLAQVCLEAARLLDLPVITVVEESPLHEQIEDGLDLIKRLNPKGKGRRVPKLPKLILTPYTISLIAVNSVLFVIFAFFVLVLVLRKP